jgi:hypothetical protein
MCAYTYFECGAKGKLVPAWVNDSLLKIESPAHLNCPSRKSDVVDPAELRTTPTSPLASTPLTGIVEEAVQNETFATIALSSPTQSCVQLDLAGDQHSYGELLGGAHGDQVGRREEDLLVDADVDVRRREKLHAVSYPVTPLRCQEPLKEQQFTSTALTLNVQIWYRKPIYPVIVC